MIMRRVAIMVATAVAVCLAGQSVYVQVKTGQVRETPSFLGEIVATVSYGEKMELVDQQGDWRKVRTGQGALGWIHKSACESKKISMTAGSENAKTSASGDEVALAGKGFNSNVEADFKSKNKNIDFTWVDIMGKNTAPAQELSAFIRNGALKQAP